MSADEDASISIDRAPEVRTLAAPSAHARVLSSRDFPTGTIIDGKYQIVAPLGEGGMGVVVAAMHLQLRETVALKFLRLDEGRNLSDLRSRFRREAQICAKVRNEHIVRVIDVGTFGDAEYMVMEHLVGTDLRRLQKETVPFPLERAVDILVQICDGLAAVHAHGIVHRDLKPSNIFVTKGSDGTELVKILDFGISKWTAAPETPDDDLTKTGAVLGSPKYMAPEQLFGSSTVDARADIWSIGAILYELVTGQAPFHQPSFARLCAELASGEPPEPPNLYRDALPEELDAAIMLCLQPNPDERLPNVAVLAGELLAAMKRDGADTVRARLSNVLGNTPGDDAMKSGQYVTQSLSVRLSVAPTATAVTQPALAPPPVAAQPPLRRGIWIAAAAAGIVIVAQVGIRAMGQPSTAAQVVAAPREAPAVTLGAAPESSAPPPLVAPVVTVAPIASAPKPVLAIQFTTKVTASASVAPPPPPAAVALEKKKLNPLEERE